MPVDGLAPKAFMEALQGINLTILLCHGLGTRHSVTVLNTR
jgi:hypothetical protein